MTRNLKGSRERAWASARLSAARILSPAAKEGAGRAVAPACGFQLFGMMPACVLPKGHAGPHEDGFGGYYGRGAPGG